MGVGTTQVKLQGPSAFFFHHLPTLVCEKLQELLLPKHIQTVKRDPRAGCAITPEQVTMNGSLYSNVLAGFTKQ